MCYGALQGGKRLRPFLHITAAKAVGAKDLASAFDIACAIEMVHAYSLIHDDLPAMDNSPLRRGKPSVHAAFDEATALLAGNALYGRGLEILAALNLSAPKRLGLLKGLLEAAGPKGMMGGQCLDMETEKKKPQDFSLNQIEKIQELKTGALITYSLSSAAIAFGKKRRVQKKLVFYGQALGLAFQIVDDLLDVKGEVALAGKPVKADGIVGKINFVSFLGPQKAYQKAQSLMEQACAALEGLEEESVHLLSQLAHYCLTRLS